MSSELAALQEDVKSYQEQLETVQSGLQADPGNAELQALATELSEAITALETLISELEPASDVSASKQAPPPPPPPPAEKPKWDPEKHPAFQAAYRKPEPPAPAEESKAIVYKVGDTVLAKWLSGDKGFYPARITSITGSSSDPVYYVSFKSYNTTETLRSGDIKLTHSDSKKRKADGSPAVASAGASAAPLNPNVISAAANIDQDLAQAAKLDASKGADGPAKPAKAAKKIKAKKELEAGKSKWQDFNAKAKGGKMGKKDSMFRTGDSVTARVGFVGSGNKMRDHGARNRHIHAQNDDDGNY